MKYSIYWKSAWLELISTGETGLNDLIGFGEVSLQEFIFIEYCVLTW